MNTGQKVWTHTFESHNWGPVLTTGGGLVFAGRHQRPLLPRLRCQDRRSLWQCETNSGITAVPSSFAVDGVQYVAVQSGWGVDAQRMQESPRHVPRHEDRRAAGRRHLGLRREEVSR